MIPQDKMKRRIPYFLIIGLFAILALAYFTPILSGKVLYQNDIAQHQGSAQEINAYMAAHNGDDPYWSNRMFGGMPDYMNGAQFSHNYIKYVDNAIRFLPRPADYVFLYFFSFFILMIAMRIGWRKALVGALMFGLSAYFFIILEAGHNSKAHAIGYMPLIIAAVIMAYRGQYFWGGLLMAFGMGLEIYANHIQMTYYLGLALGILVIIYLFEAIRERWTVRWLSATGILLAGVVVALGMNASRLLTSWSYQGHTIRGGSELHQSSDSQKNKGLDKDYILAWSYGKVETFNLMIPNLYGGASGTALDKESNLYKVLVPMTGAEQAAQIVENAPTYWGAQPFTSGPAYAGAIVVFLFILGLMIVPGAVKWWLAAATVLSFMLAWGENAMWLSDWMIDYFPLYNKFRTVSSALVIAEITMPILAVLALKEWFYRSEEFTLTTKQRKISILSALGLSAGVCLIFWLFGSLFFSFSNPMDGQMFGEMGELIRAIEADREAMMASDAIRSALFILVAGAVLWFAAKERKRANAAVLIIGVLVLFDMWGVNRRYLNNDNFVNPVNMNEPFRGTVSEYAYKQLAGDKDYFRVWNRAVNTMSDASTSYYFNSLGGYSAAKLQRYQELWDYHISQGNKQVVDMLNVKYVIEPAAEQGTAPKILLNEERNGAGWFVDNIQWVKTADEELEALSGFDSKITAVVHEDFKDRITTQVSSQKDSTATIELINYQPNHLTYQGSTPREALAVFSEIYYPDGWNAYIDGRAVPHLRANYILRSLVIPEGKHTVEFKFEPKEVTVGVTTGIVSAMLVLTASIVFIVVRMRKSQCKKS